MAYIARAVCVRWTHYGVFRLARGDGMLWVAGGQRPCTCVHVCAPRTCELSVSVTSPSRHSHSVVHTRCMSWVHIV